VYQLVVYPEAHDQIAALPADALAAYASVHDVLELAPGKGRRYMRTTHTGQCGVGTSAPARPGRSST
jgi:hypothetical protein